MKAIWRPTSWIGVNIQNARYLLMPAKNETQEGKVPKRLALCDVGSVE